jgi:hypothetical protein
LLADPVLRQNVRVFLQDINQILELPLQAAGVPGQEELTQENLCLGNVSQAVSRYFG